MRTMGNLLLGLALCFILPESAQAKVLGTMGRVYSIAETDALQEIEMSARGVDWQSILGKERPEDFRPANLVRLPRARHTRSFLLDMTYTLDSDIPDGKGGVLYPRGYRFNPLDYVPFNQTLVILDGEDPAQTAWLMASPLAVDPKTIVLLSQGSFSRVGKELGRAVFYADRRIVERFRLAAVPSVVSRKGRLMEVKEIEIPSSDISAR